MSNRLHARLSIHTTVLDHSMWRIPVCMRYGIARSLFHRRDHGDVRLQRRVLEAALRRQVQLGLLQVLLDRLDLMPRENKGVS